MALPLTMSVRCRRWLPSAHLCTAMGTVHTSSHRQSRRRNLQRGGGVRGPTAPPRYRGAADSSTASHGGAAAQRYPVHRRLGWPATRRTTARRRPHRRLDTFVLVFEKPYLTSICRGDRHKSASAGSAGVLIFLPHLHRDAATATSAQNHNLLNPASQGNDPVKTPGDSTLTLSLSPVLCSRAATSSRHPRRASARGSWSRAAAQAAPRAAPRASWASPTR